MQAKLIAIFEQSKREKGALTKHTVKYDAIDPQQKMNTVYVGQQDLIAQFGRFPQRIIVYVLNGDAQDEAAPSLGADNATNSKGVS